MKNRILIVTTLFLFSVSPAGLADDVRVSVTHPQIIRSAPVITLPGKFVARNEIAIGSPLQQQTVTAVFAEEGQPVEKNQLLATLESPLQSAAVRQLQAETEKAAAYIRQQSVLAAQSQRDLTRMTKLARSGVISASEFEKAKSDTQAQRALVDAGRQNCVSYRRNWHGKKARRINQKSMLRPLGLSVSATRYRACCLITPCCLS